MSIIHHVGNCKSITKRSYQNFSIRRMYDISGMNYPMEIKKNNKMTIYALQNTLLIIHLPEKLICLF